MRSSSMRVGLDIESPLSGSSNGALPPEQGSWRLRDVSIRRLLSQQDWGGLAATVAICIGLLIAEAALDGPRDRPFTINDATIGFPYLPSTVPYWVVIVVSVLALVGSILVAELVLARRLHASATDAAAAALFFFLDGLSAFFMSALVTEVSKRVVGRMRPNFLSICQPAGNGTAAVISWGDPASANPACTAADSGELTDAHYSFPSGHTSSVFAFSVWTAAYCLWAFNMRRRRTAAEVVAMGLRQRLCHELTTCCGLLWALALILYAWAVGVSRITDFKHHPSDVIAGAFLGTLFGLLYAVRATARVDGVAAGVGAMGGGDVATPDPSCLLLRSSRQPDRSDAATL